MLLVALRVTIGWHFLYEGVWKIENADEFSAEPFLSQAKGPAAPLFYQMLPDIDGRRLVTRDEGGYKVTAQAYTDAWKDLGERVTAKYALSGEQQKQVQTLYSRYAKSANDYVADSSDAIRAHFESLDRHRETVADGNQGAPFQQQRLWEKQMEYRQEAGQWTGELDAIGEEYQLALWNTLTPEQKAQGNLPTRWTQMNLMDLAVTYGLSAIGFCLMIGLCSRLAALGGAAFLVAVLLTQPPWPTIYPHAPRGGRACAGGRQEFRGDGRPAGARGVARGPLGRARLLPLQLGRPPDRELLRPEGLLGNTGEGCQHESHSRRARTRQGEFLRRLGRPEPA